MARANSCWSLGWADMCCEPQLLGFSAPASLPCAKCQSKLCNISVAAFPQLRKQDAVSSGASLLWMNTLLFSLNFSGTCCLSTLFPPLQCTKLGLAAAGCALCPAAKLCARWNCTEPACIYQNGKDNSVQKCLLSSTHLFDQDADGSGCVGCFLPAQEGLLQGGYCWWTGTFSFVLRSSDFSSLTLPLRMRVLGSLLFPQSEIFQISPLEYIMPPKHWTCLLLQR